MAPERCRRRLEWNSGVKKLAIVVLGVILVVAAASMRMFSIPSGSEIPILIPGDTVLAGRFSYGISAASFGLPASLFPGRAFASDPKQGDLAMFLFPRDNRTVYVKRVIGLPGDRVQMKDGRLFLNGAIVPRQEDGTYEVEDNFGQKVPAPRYIETLPNGVKHEIIEVNGDTGYYDNTEEFVVPAGQYFLLGDNRDNSDDSRDMTTSGVGFVPADNFISKAWAVFFSTKGDTGRMFKPIQ
jgi:signal peptidase I